MVFLGGKEGVSSIQTLAHILGEDSQKIAFFFSDMLGDEVEFVEYVVLRSGKLKPCWKTCADEFSKEVET